MNKLYLVIAKHHLPGVLPACPRDLVHYFARAESAQDDVHQPPNHGGRQQASAEIIRDVPEIVKVRDPLFQEGRVRAHVRKFA